MTTTCSKCGGTMEKGYSTAEGLMGTIHRHEARLQFVVSNGPTSINPIKAFQQGLADEHPPKVFRMEGFRCAKCGFIELYGRHG